MKNKILIIFAVLAEAQKTLERFKAVPFKVKNESKQNVHLYRFEYGWIVLSGMGTLAAQMSVATHSTLCDEIWNIGLAGRLCGTFSFGELVSVKAVSKYISLPNRKLDCKSYEMLKEIHPSFFFQEGDAHLVTSDFPIHDHEHRKCLSQNFDIVDMESYGIAYSSAFLGKKCRIWKIISDFCTSEGRALIQKNKDMLSERIADHLEKELCRK